MTRAFLTMISPATHQTIDIVDGWKQGFLVHSGSYFHS